MQEQEPTSTGVNRTGMGTAPINAGGMLENTSDTEAAPGDRVALAQERIRWIQASEAVGTVPPPPTPKGVLSTAKEMIKGHKPTVLIDKLGDRLAFERTGVRLYDALLAKFDAMQAGWDNGPTRDRLEHIRNEELQHFFLLKEAVEKLGADPTVMTPMADISAVASSGVLKVVSDPRVTLLQSLHAALIAERADVDGWDGLIALADAAGEDKLRKQFSRAMEEENEHVQYVKGWVTAGMQADIRRDLGH